MTIYIYALAISTYGKILFGIGLGVCKAGMGGQWLQN